MASAIYVDYACDTINSTSTTSPDGVITTFRRLGTLKTYRSAGSWVPPKRPLSVSWLPVAFQYSSTSPNFWNIWPPILTPWWQATQPRLWPRMRAYTPALPSCLVGGLAALTTRARWRILLLRSHMPRRHAEKHPIPHDQGVKQHRPHMGDEHHKQEIGEDRMRFPQQGIQPQVVRKDRRQVQRAREHNGIARCRQHPPSNHGLSKQQSIQHHFRRRRRPTFLRRHRGRKRWRRMQPPVHIPNDNQDQNRHPQRAMH